MRIKRLCNAKKGFSLIEVIIALAILMIVTFGLLTSYYSYYRNVADLRIQTTGQNLAQLQLEDIQNLASTVLVILVQGGEYLPNYPLDTASDIAIYDSGQLADASFTIESLVSVPANLLLPSSIEVQGPDAYGEYTLILLKEVFPHYKKQIVITDRTPDLDTTKKIFEVKVTIFWDIGGVEKSITITGEKNDARFSD
ncbi:MAG: type II secretion system protein [Caldisericota bacterium]|nr:type II secretion system protein [Caldisericota bacterium]